MKSLIKLSLASALLLTSLQTTAAPICSETLLSATEITRSRSEKYLEGVLSFTEKISASEKLTKKDAEEIRNFIDELYNAFPLIVQHQPNKAQQVAKAFSDLTVAARDNKKILNSIETGSYEMLSYKAQQFLSVGKLTDEATSVQKTSPHSLRAKPIDHMEEIKFVMNNYSDMLLRLEAGKKGLQEFTSAGWMYRMTHGSQKDLHTKEVVAASYGLLLVSTQLAETALKLRTEGNYKIYASLLNTIRNIDSLLIGRRNLAWSIENSLGSDTMQTYWATAIAKHNVIRAKLDKKQIGFAD